MENQNVNYNDYLNNKVSEVSFVEEKKLNEINFIELNSVHAKFEQTSQRNSFRNLTDEYKLKKKCLEYLRYYSNDPKKQQKVIFYSQILNIFLEEYFLISLIEIDDDHIESNMIKHFINNEIKNTHDFIHFYNQYTKTKEETVKTKELIKLKI